MLPPEPTVLAAREGFPDAQLDLAGLATPLGQFNVSWYGTQVSDERGSFALVDPVGSLAGTVGNLVEVRVGLRSVIVYVIGSYTGLLTPLALTRRAFAAVGLLSASSVYALVGVLK